MKLSIHKFTQPGDFLFYPTGTSPKRPLEPGRENRVANFIADIRKQYAEKKKNLSPSDKKYRPRRFGTFSSRFFSSYWCKIFSAALMSRSSAIANSNPSSRRI